MVNRTTRDAIEELDFELWAPAIEGKMALAPETMTSLRRMLTNLLYQRQLPRTMALMSSVRGEGVTYNAIALGTTLATDISTKVCVVELNWWAPGLQAHLAGRHATLAAKKRRKNEPEPEPLVALPGAAGVVRGLSTLDEALVATSVRNMDVLPAGEVPMHDRAAFARSEQLSRMMADLRERYDYLIVDLPAILLTSDAIALAACCAVESACLVVRQGVTQINSVKSALDEIQHLQILGIILNQARVATPGWLLNLIPQE